MMYLDTAKMRRPAIVEDEGLASVAEMEDGFSRNKQFLASKRNAAFMAISSQRFGLFHDSCSQEPRHFLDACHLCGKPIGQNADIFMYRGDTPFCSEGCRQEQIDIDEDLEKSVGVASPSSSKKNPKKATTNDGKSHYFKLRAGTVVTG